MSSSPVCGAGSASPARSAPPRTGSGLLGAMIETATFVPPPPGELAGLLSALEHFVHDDPQLPPLGQAALVHYQFETIHPFLDGNGRIGRLLIVFFLVVHDRLPSPLLYLSPFFEGRRQAYYDALQGIRQRVNSTAGSGCSWTASRPRRTALNALRQLETLGILGRAAEGPREQLRWRAPEVLQLLVAERTDADRLGFASRTARSRADLSTSHRPDTLTRQSLQSAASSEAVPGNGTR